MGEEKSTPAGSEGGGGGGGALPLIMVAAPVTRRDPERRYCTRCSERFAARIRGDYLAAWFLARDRSGRALYCGELECRASKAGWVWRDERESRFGWTFRSTAESIRELELHVVFFALGSIVYSITIIERIIITNDKLKDKITNVQMQRSNVQDAGVFATCRLII
jgi:MYXO-CTERM domain-containing protein